MSVFHSNLAGKQFGRLTVKSYAGTSSWNCECSCGNETTVLTERLNSGWTRSCGCLVADTNTKHGLSNSKIHRVWIAMRHRCENSNNHAFHNYGARGITVCERWQTFANFLEDMGPMPSPRMQVDRIDNSRGYSPDNCRWATSKKNLNNKRTNRRISFQGREQTIAQWAEEIQVNYRTLNNRINRGWTVERALTEPIGKDKL